MWSCRSAAAVAWSSSVAIGLPPSGAPLRVMFLLSGGVCNDDSLRLAADGGCVDQIDERIVALLRDDARRSFQDIGQHVHLSAPAIKRRVDRLEAAGVIRGYTAVVDPAASGWHTEAFVYLYCDGGMAADAIKRAVESE